MLFEVTEGGRYIDCWACFATLVHLSAHKERMLSLNSQRLSLCFMQV